MSTKGSVSGDLYRVMPDGTGLRRLTTSQDMTVLFQVSPDGSKIVFSTGSQFDSWNVGVMNVDGSRRHMLTEAGPLGSPTYAVNEFPSWLPDGSAIRYYRNTADMHVPGPGQGLWIVKPDGSDPRLVRSNWVPFEPAWSPDGTHIAYDDDKGIAITNPYGQNQRQLINDFRANQSADWSPDGSKLAFGDNGTIQVIGADGSGRKTLFSCNSCSDASFPTWSPDGTKIAFIVSGKIGASEIEVMNADGTDAHPIMVGSSLIPARLDWQPVPDRGA